MTPDLPITSPISEDPNLINPQQEFATVLEAAKQGEDWAWTRLYRQLAGPITGYLSNRGAPDPEDLTGETFLQAARNIQSFEGTEASFRSWIFVIAHRRLIDARRAAGKRAETSLEVHFEDPVGGDVEAEAVDRITTDEVESALAILTEDQRDVLALRVIANLTLEETARVVGKKVGAVKALQRRGLAAMRESFDLPEVSK
jgi:RNA polymerase sigma-70 factor (ECF subfamily)